MKALKGSIFIRVVIIGIFILGLGCSNIIRVKALSCNEEYNKIQASLPPNMEVINKNSEDSVPFIEKKDINGDKKIETLAVCKDTNIKNAFFLLILDENSGDFQVKWTIKGEGDSIDLLQFSDIDGDKKEDIILGGRIGTDYCKVNVINIANNEVNKLFSITYSKLEVISKGIYGNKSEQSALAIQVKDREEAYKTSIVRWNGKELVEAKDLYKQYCRKLVEYYDNKVKEVPEVASYWYYLADAQSKCGLKDDALKSISKGVSLDQSYPTKQQFEELKKGIK